MADLDLVVTDADRFFQVHAAYVCQAFEIDAPQFISN
jgi:hypothetical protein